MRITAIGDKQHGVLRAEIIKGLQDEASTERERAKGTPAATMPTPTLRQPKA
jgi:hypothetical protein